jgi:ATP-dependent Lon protease
MEMEITLPDEVPVMTLPNVTFFPQALLPLHIFEPRYREMLRDVLATNRLFAVAGLNPRALGEPGQFEPPHRIASVGIVRACQKNDNGTANLLLQGLCRVEIAAIVADEPYRRIRIRALASQPGATDDGNAQLRRDLARLIALKLKLASVGGKDSGPGEMAAFLKTVDDPEAFVDIAAFSLCEDAKLKQKLLETLDVRRRLELFSERVRGEIADLKLRRKLQGLLADDHIADN